MDLQDQLEAAADTQGVRLHLLVGGREDTLKAARSLSRLMDEREAEKLEASGGRWSIRDTRRCIQRLRSTGGPIIADLDGASRRDLDALLVELETPGERVVIACTSVEPSRALSGRGTLVRVSPGAPSRRRSGAPSAEEMAQRLPGLRCGDHRPASILREHAGSAFGARLAAAMMRSRRYEDLPPELLGRLMVHMSRPPTRRSTTPSGPDEKTPDPEPQSTTRP